MKTVLTIAGSDCSGGAGIQADIKTMMANYVYGMSVITALTAQNTLGITGIVEVEPDFVQKQMDAIFSDIFPNAVKIGMMPTSSLISTIAETLKRYGATNIVLDPVMVSTSGSRLIDEEAIDVLTKKLIPLTTLITPNIPETEVLFGKPISSEEDMEIAAKEISNRYGVAVLCKGGHSVKDANDVLVYDGLVKWFKGRRLDNPNTHGTGCTLSSSIAAHLAQGYSLEESVKKAKEYLSGAIEAGLDLGAGNGPLNHAYHINKITKNERGI